MQVMATETEPAAVGGSESPASLYDRIADDGLLPVAALVALAVGLGVIVTVNFYLELLSLPTSLPPLIAAVQGYLPVAGFAYGAAWLRKSDFDPVGRWRVAFASYGGLLLFGGTTAVTIAVRLAESRIVGEPQYVLVATAGAGGLAGLLMGIMYARSVQTAEEAAETRDQFELMNSILRHDILNRTMIIRSRASFISDEADGRIAEFADTIVTQSDDVADQVERTRALLNALSGEDRDLAPEPLAPAVANNVESMRATHEGLEIHTNVPDIKVLADETLQDVVGNVLSNAVEHNDQPVPRIEVTVEETDSYVDLRVADNGPGVPDEVKDAIFRRDDTGLHEDGTGSGFGLFFVDAMLSDFGGDVWVEDRDTWLRVDWDDGGGSVFVLRFRRPDLAE